ncbi:MAG: hypothetical protein ACP5NV_01105 [Candidatus Woesearchaeota archaeon]
MPKKKLLIIAGTHQREIEFSHGVADLLLDKHGLDKKKPFDKIVGVDMATEANVWINNDIVIAKLHAHGDGEPSTEWQMKQSIETLTRLYIHKINCATQKNPPRIAEAYGGNGQWTSVHDKLIQYNDPLFFIDLHSYHINTQNTFGRGLQINSYSKKLFNPIIQKALNIAQEKHPEIYGLPTIPFKDSCQIKKSIENKYFSKAELVSALKENFEDELIIKKINLKKSEYEEYANKELDRLYSNGWFFVDWGNPEPRGNYFLFEAKHWQKNQQEATATFITEYLLPEFNNSKNKFIK